MPPHPDPTELWPDVVAAGGLAATLAAAVSAHGLDTPIPVDSTSVYYALVPTLVPHRGPLEVSASYVERRWFIRGCDRDQDLALVEGSTPDLAQVARAAQTWHDGVALEDVATMVPFVRLTGRFEVSDRDPARMVESEWRHLHTEADQWQEKFPEFGALIRAAYAEPRLRRLYPFTSHWTLRFSTRTRPSLSRAIRVCVHPSPGKPYVVTMDYTGEEIGRTADAPQAASLAVSHLPNDLGPIVFGSPDHATPGSPA